MDLVTWKALKTFKEAVSLERREELGWGQQSMNGQHE